MNYSLESLNEGCSFSDILRCSSKKVFVNVYSETRHYGGPEEGGWYYNHLEPVRVSACNSLEEAETVQASLEQFCEDNSEGDIYSVLGGEKWVALIEDSPGESYPQSRPFYC